MPKSLVSRIRLIYLPFDLIFGVLIPLAVVNAIGPADSAWALLVLYGIGLGRTAGNMIMIGRIFGPAVRWMAIARDRPEPREIREADEGLRLGAARFTLASMILWVVHLALGMIVLLFVDRY